MELWTNFDVSFDLFFVPPGLSTAWFGKCSNFTKLSVPTMSATLLQFHELPLSMSMFDVMLDLIRHPLEVYTKEIVCSLIEVIPSGIVVTSLVTVRCCLSLLKTFR